MTLESGFNPEQKGEEGQITKETQFLNKALDLYKKLPEDQQRKLNKIFKQSFENLKKVAEKEYNLKF
ncbi:hypothetical protein HY750_03115 [Candidatus Kuenenbacteria bacterium]|nr:hypothetical protein [Candidatus Kuenenbacteria bacterium]